MAKPKAYKVQLLRDISSSNSRFKFHTTLRGALTTDRIFTNNGKPLLVEKLKVTLDNKSAFNSRRGVRNGEPHTVVNSSGYVEVTGYVHVPRPEPYEFRITQCNEWVNFKDVELAIESELLITCKAEDVTSITLEFGENVGVRLKRTGYEDGEFRLYYELELNHRLFLPVISLRARVKRDACARMAASLFASTFKSIRPTEDLGDSTVHNFSLCEQTFYALRAQQRQINLYEEARQKLDTLAQDSHLIGYKVSKADVVYVYNVPRMFSVEPPAHYPFTVKLSHGNFPEKMPSMKNVIAVLNTGALSSECGAAIQDAIQKTLLVQLGADNG